MNFDNVAFLFKCTR